MAFCPVCERNSLFNLEPAIAEWRQQMLAAGRQTPAPLEELEGHLREEIERQLKSGLSLNEQAAFKAAVQKVGRAALLQKEFGKVGEIMPVWARKMNCTVCAMVSVLVCAVGLIVLFIKPHSVAPDARAMANFLQLPRLRPESFLIGERISLAGACLSTGLLLSAWMFLWRSLPALLRPRARLAAAYLCVILSGLCAMILLQFLPLGAGTIEELAIAVAWAIIPIWAACAFIFGLAEAAY